MPFNKDTAKEAGRISKRGSDNQLKELREAYSNLLESNSQNIQTWLDRVAKDNPAKALELFIKMGAFVMPKLKSVEVIDNTPKENPIIHFYSSDSNEIKP